MKDFLVRRSYVLDFSLRETAIKEERLKDFFQRALAYEKTIAREGGILMPH